MLLMLNIDPGMYMYCAARVRFIRELNYFRAGHFETTNYEKLYSLHNSERCLTHIRGQIGIEFYVGVYNNYYHASKFRSVLSVPTENTWTVRLNEVMILEHRVL